MSVPVVRVVETLKTYLVCDEKDVPDHTNSKPTYAVETSVLRLVAEIRADDISKEAANVDGDCQCLNNLTAPSTSKTVDDGW